MKKIKYPELAAEMARRGETQKTVADLLGIAHSSLSRRLSGKIEWSIGQIETLCEHYGKDYYELFKRNND